MQDAFPHQPHPPLSLFNKYILLLWQVPKIYTCQSFRLWVKQYVIQMKKPRLREGVWLLRVTECMCCSSRTQTSISWVLGSGLILLSVPVTGANWPCKNTCVFPLRAFREKPCCLLRTSVMLMASFSLHREIYGSCSWQDTDGILEKILIKGPGAAP